jgi:hypothetical protein
VERFAPHVGRNADTVFDAVVGVPSRCLMESGKPRQRFAHPGNVDGICQCSTSSANEHVPCDMRGIRLGRDLQRGSGYGSPIGG